MFILSISAVTVGSQATDESVASSSKSVTFKFKLQNKSINH